MADGDGAAAPKSRRRLTLQDVATATGRRAEELADLLGLGGDTEGVEGIQVETKEEGVDARTARATPAEATASAAAAGPAADSDRRLATLENKAKFHGTIVEELAQTLHKVTVRIAPKGKSTGKQWIDRTRRINIKTGLRIGTQSERGRRHGQKMGHRAVDEEQDGHPGGYRDKGGAHLDAAEEDSHMVLRW